MKSRTTIHAIPSFKFGSFGCCAYCGDNANCVDHVIPRSYQTERKTSTRVPIGPRTFACRTCNATLSNRYFDTFFDRCQWMRDRYERKAKPVIWSEEQLAELTDPHFREWIRNKQKERLFYRYRADWAGTRDYLLNLEGLKSESTLSIDSADFHAGLGAYFAPTMIELHALHD